MSHPFWCRDPTKRIVAACLSTLYYWSISVYILRELAPEVISYSLFRGTCGYRLACTNVSKRSSLAKGSFEDSENFSFFLP